MRPAAAARHAFPVARPVPTDPHLLLSAIRVVGHHLDAEDAVHFAQLLLRSGVCLRCPACTQLTVAADTVCGRCHHDRAAPR